MPNPGDQPVAPRGRSSILLVGLAAGVAAIAVIARFVTTSPLWLDEALSANIADLPVGDIAGALEHDGHPPLYYVLLHAWMRIVGEGDVAVRALSGVAGVAALPLAALAGRRVGGRRVALAALLLVGLSPFAVRYATEARMYALVMVAVLAGHLLVRRAVDDRRAGPATRLGAAALTAALLWTHYWSTYLVAATVLVLAWWGRRPGSDERAVALRLGTGAGLGAVAFVPWVPSLLEQASHTGTPWAGPARPGTVIDETLQAFGGGDFAEARLLGALLVVLVLAGLLGRSPDGSRELRLGAPSPGTVAGEAAVVGLTMALGTLAGFVGGTTYAPRYAAVVFPLVALVAARGLAVLPGRAVAAGAAALVGLLGLAGIVENVVADRTQAGVLAELVAAEAGPGDAVVVCPDQLGPATRRALDSEGLEAVPVLAYPTLGDGRFVDWYDYEERNDVADPVAVATTVLERVPAGSTIWVVWNGSYRTFHGDCERLLETLDQARPDRRVLAVQDSEFFEHASLEAFAGP